MKKKEKKKKKRIGIAVTDLVFSNNPFELNNNINELNYMLFLYMN